MWGQCPKVRICGAFAQDGHDRVGRHAKRQVQREAVVEISQVSHPDSYVPLALNPGERLKLLEMLAGCLPLGAMHDCCWGAVVKHVAETVKRPAGLLQHLGCRGPVDAGRLYDVLKQVEGKRGDCGPG